MQSKYEFIILIFGLIIFSSGDDGSNCPGDITLPLKISPDLSYFKKGDTILISSKINNLIFDKKTDKSYDASNYKFTPFIQLCTIDSPREYNEKSKINEVA